MPKNLPVKHVLDIYGAELHLASNAKQWKRLSKQLTFLGKEVPKSQGRTEFAVFEPKKKGPHVPHVVFWIDPKGCRDVFDFVDTCAHEAAHGTGQLFLHLGHEIRGTDEPSAYLIGWLTSWIMRNTPYSVE